MKRYILAISLIFVTVWAYAETKQEKIERLMRMTGSAEMGVMIFDNMIGQFMTLFPDVPMEYWEEMYKIVDTDEITSMIVPIYDQFFSSEEIDQLIDFYTTDIGKKLIERTPMITNESMRLGQEWGEKIGEEILNKMRDDGLIDT
jgi:D-alanyl-lipoteichoic acid acyltransferase DltB (MBOAT superfamily)